SRLVSMFVAINAHRAGHPRRDTSARLPNPVDVRDERATVKQRKVADTEPAVGPERCRCESDKAGPELIEQTQPLSALRYPIDQRRENMLVVPRCDSPTGFETMHIVRE